MKETVAFTIEPDQLAMLRAYAKDNGSLSTSAALRQILAEWRRMKAGALRRDEEGPEPLADTELE